MEVRVPWVSEKTIEAQAISLLERYVKEHEPILKPPVPVDEIPEMLLKVRLEFDDLRKLLGRNDAIGATWFDTSEIYIDQSLDPTENPRKVGRYRFTVGHEIGHWVLHRQFVPNRGSQMELFEGRAPEPSILCRESSKREPAEWQADRFASCLLMPADLVVETSKVDFLHLSATEYTHYRTGTTYRSGHSGSLSAITPTTGPPARRSMRGARASSRGTIRRRRTCARGDARPVPLRPEARAVHYWSPAKTQRSRHSRSAAPARTSRTTRSSRCSRTASCWWDRAIASRRSSALATPPDGPAASK